MLQKLKDALQITTNDFDPELNDLIKASILDLNIAGVDAESVGEGTTNSLVIRVIISYCAYHFELVHGDLKKADALKNAYDEQKAMLGMSTGYTTW